MDLMRRIQTLDEAVRDYCLAFALHTLRGKPSYWMPSNTANVCPIWSGGSAFP